MSTAGGGERFWEMPLTALNKEQWESLCDGCGRCCLQKLELVDACSEATPASIEIAFTRVICRYYDEHASRCSCYSERKSKVPDCLVVNEHDIATLPWMPSTCAYRLRFENKPLYDWHPLIAGDRNAMDEAGISVAGKVISEQFVHEEGLEEHIIRWVSAE